MKTTITTLEVIKIEVPYTPELARTYFCFPATEESCQIGIDYHGKITMLAVVNSPEAAQAYAEAHCAGVEDGIAFRSHRTPW